MHFPTGYFYTKSSRCLDALACTADTTFLPGPVHRPAYKPLGFKRSKEIDGEVHDSPR